MAVSTSGGGALEQCVRRRYTKGGQGSDPFALMPQFLATAVFEVQARSREAADETATTLFKRWKHARVRCEGVTASPGFGYGAPGAEDFFAVLGDFTVEAPSAERAAGTLEDALDELPTDTVRYIAHGVEEGPVAEEGARARRRERPRVSVSGEEAEEVAAVEAPPAAGEPEVAPETVAAAPPKVPEKAPAEEREAGPPVAAPAPPPPPKVPVFVAPSALHVTFAVTLASSELAGPNEDARLLSEEILLQRAVERARTSQAGVPVGLSPRTAFSAGAAGDKLVTLVWEFESPVSAARPRAAAEA